eukprot:13897704-Ditylum_brightwellii.AAC.1
MNTMQKSIDNLTAALRDLCTGANQSAGIGQRQQGKHYCWSHGETGGEHHTSTNCHKRRDGHQENATFYDRKNGSNAISYRCT